MNGSVRIVADTNVYFMFFYDPSRKAGQLINAALDKKVELFSPDTVKEELKRVLIRELGFEDARAENIINYLPATWIDRKFYGGYLGKAAIIRHRPDRPVLALALALNCGIITANIKDFKSARKITKLWKIDDLLEKLT